MPPHPSTDFEIRNYYQNKPKTDGVYSRNNLSKIKYEAYIINLDEYESIGAYWIALYVNAKDVTCLDGFEVGHIPKVIRKFLGNKSIITNVYRKQAYDLITGGYFYVGFIDFILKGKSLLGYLSSLLMIYDKDDKIILKYFQ